MAGCCLSLTIVCGSILPNLPPETVPWGTPPHTKNCRVEVFLWLPPSSSGIIYCPIVPSSGLSTGIGFECVKHSHQWLYGWELTSFLRNRQEGIAIRVKNHVILNVPPGCRIWCVWAETLNQNHHLPAASTLSTHLIVVSSFAIVEGGDRLL